MDVQIGTHWISPKVDATFVLCDEISSDGAREHEVRVPFGRPFRAAPVVMATFASIDFSDAYRCALQVRRVDALGFDLAVLTEARSIVYGVQVAFVAYVNAKDALLQSGNAVKYATDAAFAVLTRGVGRRIATEAVRFPVTFASDAKVFFGISAIGGTADLKFSARLDKLTRSGFDLVLTAWGDTTLERLSVSWFAYPKALETASRDFRLVSDVAKFANDAPGFLLHAGAGPRSFDVPIVTHAPKGGKSKPPTIVSSLVGLGANAADADVRLKTSVDVASSKLSVGTWADTKIESGMAMWIACYELPRSAAAAAAAAAASASTSLKSAPKRPAVPAARDSSDDDDDSGSGSGSGSSEKKAVVLPVAKKSKVAAEKPAAKKKPTSASSASTASTAIAVTADVASSDDEEVAGGKECKICFDAEIDAVFVPCGHQCACHACATLLAGAKGKALCPICTAKIDMVVKTFTA